VSTTYQIVCLSETLSPVTHMAGTAGNESIVAREPLATPRGTMWAPYLSGNAIRHRMVRAPGMRWLVDAYGLRGRLSLTQLNFLFHGGALTDGGGREDTRRIAEWQRLWPLGRLLGGTLPDQILAGSLHAWRGALVCEENRAYVDAVLPGIVTGPLRPAESFVSGYQYTRSDAGKTAPDLAPPDAGERDSNLMIYAGQAVLRGAAFIHGFTVLHASEAELGALMLSLRLWQAEGGTIGGQARVGHGRLLLSVVSGVDVAAQDGAVAAYLDATTANRDDAVAWLEAAFARRTERPAKGKGKVAVAEVDGE